MRDEPERRSFAEGIEVSKTEMLDIIDELQERWRSDPHAVLLSHASLITFIIYDLRMEIEKRIKA